MIDSLETDAMRTESTRCSACGPTIASCSAGVHGPARIDLTVAHHARRHLSLYEHTATHADVKFLIPGAADGSSPP